MNGEESHLAVAYPQTKSAGSLDWGVSPLVLVTLPILGDVSDAILRLVSGKEEKVRE